MDFPAEVIDDIGAALSAAQFGGKSENAKPWKGLGSGIFEIVDDYRSDTYRAVYTVRFKLAVCVLHAFQKKSRSGIETDQRDVAMIESRLRDARTMYEAEFGVRR